MENYTSWKKDLLKLCKTWDSAYMKHIKAKIYDEMNNNIHMPAMKPLTNLVTANGNLWRLQQMMKKDPKEIPQFRLIALEEEFSKFMTGVCDIFRDYGQLNIHYDIRQMLKTLKIENWDKIVPFKQYLDPLDKALTTVRNRLLKMEKEGILYVKYIIENNTELHDECIEMVKKDFIA
jgi:hypothetical protein